MIGRYAFTGLLGTGLLAFAAWGGGLHWNTSPSMPEGLWRTTAFHAPRRGEVVTFCPPPAAAALALARGYIAPGPCPDGSERLLKPIAAVPGDRMVVSAAGLAVNGKPIPHSHALAEDSTKRPLSTVPRGVYRVGTGEVWLISGHDPRSYDSRYYGAVPVRDIRAEATPLFIKGRKQ